MYVCVLAQWGWLSGGRGGDWEGEGEGRNSPSRLGPFGKRRGAKRQKVVILERHCSKGNLDIAAQAICTEVLEESATWRPGAPLGNGFSVRGSLSSCLCSKPHVNNLLFPQLPSK